MSLPHEQASGPHHGNIAHPLSEVSITAADKEAIETALHGIKERRDELVAQGPDQLFAGIVPGRDGGGNTLLVIDINQSSNDTPYVVRGGALESLVSGDPVQEEPIPRDRATAYRGSKQTVQSDLFGSIETGITSPVTYLEKRRREGESPAMVPFARLSNRDGSTTDAVSLEDVFSPITTADKVQIARNALDLDRQDARYPNINNDPVKLGDRWVPSGRRDQVRGALRPIIEALASEQLDDAGRARLVELGRNIMEIANNNPENLELRRSNMVINPEAAEAIAYAEEEGRQLPAPGGWFGRGRKRAEQAAAAEINVWAALREYEESLKHPRR